MNYMDKMKEYLDKDAIVSKLGFEPRPSTGERLVSALGLFGVGVLVGAGVALLLAPKSGRELREDIRSKVAGDGIATGTETTPEVGFRADQRVI
jgi:YtxH-like protein